MKKGFFMVVVLLSAKFALGGPIRVRWYPLRFECEHTVPDSALKNRLLKSRNRETGKLDCVLVPSKVGSISIYGLNCSDEFEILTHTQEDCRKVIQVIRQGSK